MSNKPVEQKAEINSEQANASGRRNFIKKGALGAALITTVSSKSAWATNCNCSGNLSNNASVQDNFQTCDQIYGYSQGAWGGNGGGDAVVVSNFIGTYYGNGVTLPNMTLEELFFNNAYLIGLPLSRLDSKAEAKAIYKNNKLPSGSGSWSKAQWVAHTLGLTAQYVLSNSNKFKGEWRQRITAALNATVWAIMLDETTNNPESAICSTVGDWFYYPLTLSAILQTNESTLSGYHNHP
ncbi:hypothetical protein [Catenovulum adriaticum]|uniref:Secreted protein n=1 Tax=Catenovulum adriaticum TaxID=2984846 RepID=A0ABY7AMF6_9ALTE|nr:hypothetical protein [Catenovulum sp. TS8]WAJ70674.1 hypothetical protein OLW01_02340 [Catenovulum sp. TS8]